MSNEKRSLDDEFADNSFRDYQYNFDSSVRELLMERWEPYFSEGGLSLEMGSFDGTMTELLRRYFNRLQVVEGSEKLASVVREKFDGSVPVHLSWFERFEPVERFDHVFLVHGLEHVEDPVGVLSRASTWLNENGKLFVAVPNANALSRQIAVQMGIVDSLQAVTEGEREQGHLRTYNLDTLCRDIHSAGLKIIDRGGVVLKALSNWQFDAAVREEIVSSSYLKACDEIAKIWPEFSASVYAVVSLK